MARRFLAIILLLAVTACSRSDPGLMNIRQPREEGPDEFAVVPSKPLEIPSDLAALPEPTPGGVNRTDPTPEADVALALGGNPEVLTRRSGDGALVAYATRFGLEPRIRGELAAEDLEYRRNNRGRVLERLFQVNVYYNAYEPMELDQYRELERLRRAGIRTSAIPPEPQG